MQTQQSRKAFAPAALLLAIMALLSGGAARRESVTVDEVAHIGAGVSYLQKLDLRMNEEHPPLAKVLAALPLVLRGVHADYSHLSWTFSDKNLNEFLGEWVFGHWLIMRWNDPYSTVIWARVPHVVAHSASWPCYIRFWLATGRRLGRAPVSLCLCEHAGVSRIRPARTH